MQEVFEEYHLPPWENLCLWKGLDKLEKIIGLVREIQGEHSLIWHGIIPNDDKYVQTQNVNATFVPHADKIFTLSDGTVLSRVPTTESLPWKVYNEQLYLSGPGTDRLHLHFRRDGICTYDNLIHVLLLVKNAGPEFRQMLQENLPLMDHWTVLDTGSTNGTQAVIRHVLGKIPGRLYEEPFVDFSTSRNRLLELAGTKCKFNLMLDDTYVLKGDLRGFLEKIRSDTFARSYSLFIRSADMEYASNRLTKTDVPLRYRYRVHEVIPEEGNVNVMIPHDVAWIDDLSSDYMKKRTLQRKQSDLEGLFLDLAERPGDPRVLYYLAQTYSCLGNVEEAYRYFRLRAEKEGFLQERIDAIFEAARLANFSFCRWKEAKYLYRWAYSLDRRRPDSLYYLGIRALGKGNNEKAYRYLSRAFSLGVPRESQYSLRPTLSYTYVPKFLTELCYKQKDYALGLESAGRYLKHNTETDDAATYRRQRDFYLVYEKLQALTQVHERKKVIALCVDGNWQPWTGSDIENKGLGGSETWAVETATHLAKDMKVFVFCRCSSEESYRGARYLDLSKFAAFCVDYHVDSVIVSRYSEYLPLAYQSTASEVYLWVHDLDPSCLILEDPKFAGIVGLSHWHASYLRERYPEVKIDYHGYGINKEEITAGKVAGRFIYASTANRGLLQLLQMWPAISEIIPTASLEVYSDLDLAWVQQVAADDIIKIRELLSRLSNVKVRGWVPKAVLAVAWQEAEYWLYPCTFQETFCHCALEAAAYGTIPITNGLAALEENANHGVIVKGDTNSTAWRVEVILRLIELESKSEKKRAIVEAGRANVKSWERQTATLQRKFLKL